MTITIKHLEGPLAGEVQTFDDSVPSVVFGRDGEVANVLYPASYDTVGRRHFELNRTKAGDYTVELFGSRYVTMNGKPVDNGTPVKPGSTFRLGDEKGPLFKVEIGGPSAAATLPVTGKQGRMETTAERLRRHVTYAGSALTIVLVAVVGYTYWLHSTLGYQIEAARAEAAARAEEQFSDATLRTLEKAVYLVARMDGGVEKAEGTAWAFAPGKLATNAHVTNAIKDHEDDFFLVAPNGDKLKIKSVLSHPGYEKFKSYKTTQGTTRWGEFTPLDLINEYDVGIIEVDPETPLPVDEEAGEVVLLDFATEEDLKKLKPGMAVASIGFPVEGLAGGATATKAPGTLHYGHISALTDVFMCRADPAHRLLIQHSVPVTGGASGSPLIDKKGKVIGIVNGGNTTVLKDPSQAVNAKVRLPSAALINFAQRVDLLQELDDGTALAELAGDETYWEERGAEFDDFFDIALANFQNDAKERYAVGDGAGHRKGTDGYMLIGTDELKASGYELVSESYAFKAEPGKVYGFIADAVSGVPIGINVKNQKTSEFVREAKDDRQTSELEPAPTAWVTVTEPTMLDVIVWSFLDQPAKFKLYAFEWDAPKPTPTAETAP